MPAPLEAPAGVAEPESEEEDSNETVSVQTTAGGEQFERSYEDDVSMAMAAPEAFESLEVEKNAAADKAGAVLVLTPEEAQELLAGVEPVWEDAVSSRYELTAGEYRALLEALGRPAEVAETDSGPFLVMVDWALE